MRWLLPLLALCLLGAVPASPPGDDYSDPELVAHYIWLECEALDYSYNVMLHDLDNIRKRYDKCTDIQDNNELANQWFGLQCVFVRQTWDFRYTHTMSVVVAYNLMCVEGERIEERWVIDFPPKP